MLFVVIFINVIPPIFCQLALASSSYISRPIKRPSSSTSGGLNVRDTRSRTLFTKYSDFQPSLRFNTSSIESEIAAIFKGVAYGSSTSSSSSTTTTEVPSLNTPQTAYRTDTTSHSIYYRNGVTEPRVFIGKQREVYSEIKTTSDSSVSDNSEKVVSSTSDYVQSKIYNNGSAYTYLIQSNKELNTEEFSNDKPGPASDNYPTFEGDRSDLKEIQVRVTSVLKKKGYDAIQHEIGKAWIFHVYLTGISFGVVAAVCLLSLSRISTCSQLLPRGYFITLHLMIFLASFLRCLLFLHDPYGAYGRLPSVLMSMLFNTVDPCLATAYSVVLLVLLRAARVRLVPLNMQSPLVLATICGIHIGGSVVIDVSSGVLEDERVIATLSIVTQAVTASWGAFLCLGYVVSFSSIEKAAQRQQGDLVRLTFNRKHLEGDTLQKSLSRPSLTYAARLFLICTLLHGLLIAFVILNLVTTKVPISATSSEAWAWWTQTSLERIIEIALCVLLLSTALVLTQAKPKNNNNNNKKEKEEKIFSILSSCGRGPKSLKNMDVYPVANEKCNILENGILNHPSLNSSVINSKNSWKHFHPHTSDQSLKSPMGLSHIDAQFQKPIHQETVYDPSANFPSSQIMQGNNAVRSHLNAENDVLYGNFFKDPRQHVISEPSPYCVHLNNHSKTLPRNNYYYSQRAYSTSKPANHNPKSNTIRVNQHPNASYCKQEDTLYYPSNQNQYTSMPVSYNANVENIYEVAPYYTHSSASTSNHTYTKPYFYISSRTIHDNNVQNYVTNKSTPYKIHETEPRSEISYGSSQSEIQVDYLTDASSSNDGLSNTLSRSLTLPLYTQHCPVKGKPESIIYLQKTPDATHPLSYLPGVEMGHSTPYRGNNAKPAENSENNPLDFLRLSTTSLNDVLKCQSGFFGKFVNGGTTIVGYSPLSLEDTSSPSSDHPIRGMRKSTSTGDLTDLKLPNKPSDSSQNDSGKHQIHSNLKNTHLKSDPVTSL